MRRKSDSFLILSISFIALMLFGVFATIPITKAAFTTFEQYGPKVNQLLIKLYANQQDEFTAFELGAIDMIDWPLDAYWINRWTGNADIVMQDYGGGLIIREFDINVAETRGICTAAGTDRSVMQPNIGTNLAFRQAVAYLVDRTYITSTILGGFGVPVYTMVPPALGSYVNTNVEKHEYSPSAAASVLAAGGIQDTDGDGYYDWPSTPWGSSNRTLVDFVVRIDDTPGRKEAGRRLIWEMTTNIRAYSGGVGFYVQEWDAKASVGARKWVLDSINAGFVIYTGGWTISREPDFLFDLYHSSMYWGPGRPPNYAWVHDPVLDGYLEGIKFGETAASVMTNVQLAQARMAEMAWNVPAWSPSAPKAVRAAYTGGTNGVPSGDAEDMYRGKAWQGFANELGKSQYSWFSTLGPHVNDANGNPMSGGVLRYGFSQPDMYSFNPIYSEWYWDWEVLGRVYDTMFAVNPYNLAEDLEWVAKRWDVGVWTTPSGEKATKLVFYLRDDVYWHDSQQFDADDIVFTMKDLIPILDSRGLPPPWFYSNLLGVNSVTKLSQFQVEVKMNVQGDVWWGPMGPSYFALHSIGGIPILPEHIWRPLATSGDLSGDWPITFAPDPQIIGSGPFKVYPHSIAEAAGDYYVPNQYVKLDACQRPNKAAAPGLGNLGYFNEDPIRITQAVHGSAFVVTVENWAKVPIEVNPVTLQVGSSTFTQGPFTVPSSLGTGNIPGSVLVVFDASSVPSGTYTIQATASFAYAGVSWVSHDAIPTWSLPAKLGDINGDGQVNTLDAIEFSFHFGMKAFVWPEEDLNYDNTINVVDALVLLTNWGT